MCLITEKSIHNCLGTKNIPQTIFLTISFSYLSLRFLDFWCTLFFACSQISRLGNSHMTKQKCKNVYIHHMMFNMPNMKKIHQFFQKSWQILFLKKRKYNNKVGNGNRNRESVIKYFP